MEVRTVFTVTSYLTTLPLLAAVLFIVFMHKRDLLKKCGFGKPEVGMILIGSLFGLFADIPLIVSGRALLNINLGGALIPLIISLNLIYKMKIRISKFFFGITIVAVTAYYFSSYVSELGIVSEFPYYFIPSVLAILIGVVLLRGCNRVAYAYSVSVLGVLIGADLVRIPMLVEDGILGSIGGAGAMDLVYLSGLLSAIPLMLFYYFKEPYSSEVHIMDQSKRLLDEGRYWESLKLNIRALNDELEKAGRILCKKYNIVRREECFNNTKILNYLSIHPYIIRDYNKLKNMTVGLDRISALKSFKTTQLLLNTIRKKVSYRYSKVGRRIAAYLIDLVVLFSPFIIFFIYLPRFSFFRENITLPVFVAAFSLAISIQFIYFTLLEWRFGTTIGKRIFGLKVVSNDITDITFIQSAARNSGRYADIVLLFYLVSMLLILKSPENKRIGDIIADTRVVKI
ncbi:MAG: DUF1614 domain-containing protein [Thermoplasmatota archaeon]